MTLREENRALRAEAAALHARIAELETLADSDALTPLPNRRYFVRQLSRLVGQVARYGQGAAVLFIDVDGLKSINDRHGHRAGDHALIHIAGILIGHVRITDVVARIGGDEFGVLLDRVDERAARDKAAALREAIAAAPLDGRLPISVSIGIATLQPGDDDETALARADQDMYGGRRDGAQRSAR